MAARHLVIDGGKSKTAAATVDVDGRVVVRVAGPGLAIIGEPGGPQAVTASLRSTLAPLGDGPFHTVVFGLNGVHAPSPTTEAAGEILRGLVAAERVVVSSDGVLGYAGAIGTASGVAVTAGTGAVLLAIGPDGRAQRVDGDGPLLGDRGSGYAIGLAGLRNGMRVLDGLDGSSALGEEVRREFGRADDAVRIIHGSPNPTRMVAAFSRNVARAADRGDPIAQSLWRKAGVDLARGVAAAARRAGLTRPFPVALSGGLFDAGALLLGAFGEELRRVIPAAELMPARGDAIAGGALLAMSHRAVLTGVSSWGPGTPA